MESNTEPTERTRIRDINSEYEVVVAKREGTNPCPLCGDETDDLCLVSLQSTTLSTTFALCKECRFMLSKSLEDYV